MNLDDRLRSEMRAVEPGRFDEDDALRRVRSTHRSRRRRAMTLRVGTALAVVIAVIATVTLPNHASPSHKITVSSNRVAQLPRDAKLARADIARASGAGVDPTPAVAGTSAFGFDLYAQLRAKPGNIIFSPESLATALAMTTEGAHGQTLTEMLHVLHASSTTELAQQLNALDQLLLAPRHDATARGGTPARLTINDSMWAQQGFPLYKTFLNAIAQYYGAGVNLVNYAKDPEAARLAINRYVDAKTDGQIPNLLPPGVVDINTVFALINTLTFKGAWQYPLEASGTGTFHRLDGSTTRVPMMTTETGDIRGPGYQAVRLAYVGGATMTIVVPDAGRFDSIDRDLGSTLADIRAHKKPDTVILHMPKFSFSSAFELTDSLRSLGMNRAFDTPGADFSAMTPNPTVYISHVLQSARISVDEHGTEAAAASAVIGEAESLPPTLSIDRPFLFTISDDATGAVLFVGRVTDPSAH